MFPFYTRGHTIPMYASSKRANQPLRNQISVYPGISKDYRDAREFSLILTRPSSFDLCVVRCQYRRRDQEEDDHGSHDCRTVCWKCGQSLLINTPNSAPRIYKRFADFLQVVGPTLYTTAEKPLYHRGLISKYDLLYFRPLLRCPMISTNQCRHSFILFIVLILLYV
jgi:hypothetical protein